MFSGMESANNSPISCYTNIFNKLSSFSYFGLKLLIYITVCMMRFLQIPHLWIQKKKTKFHKIFPLLKIVLHQAPRNDLQSVKPFTVQELVNPGSNGLPVRLEICILTIYDMLRAIAMTWQASALHVISPFIFWTVK